MRTRVATMRLATEQGRENRANPTVTVLWNLPPTIPTVANLCVVPNDVGKECVLWIVCFLAPRKWIQRAPFPKFWQGNEPWMPSVYVVSLMTPTTITHTLIPISSHRVTILPLFVTLGALPRVTVMDSVPLMPPRGLTFASATRDSPASIALSHPNA